MWYLSLVMASGVLMTTVAQRVASHEQSLDVSLR